MANERRLAVGVSYVALGEPGDGVMGTDLTEFPIVEEGTIVLNFNDPTTVDFRAEQLQDPWESLDKAGDADSIDFGIPSPTPDEQKFFMGGEVEGGKWKAPTDTPIIRKSFMFRSKPYKGHQTEYGFVNCKVSAKLDRAPSSEQTDLMLVRVTKLAATTAAGKVMSPWYREVKKVEETTPPVEGE